MFHQTAFHLVDQTEPLVHDVLGGGGAVTEAQLGDGHPCNEKRRDQYRMTSYHHGFEDRNGRVDNYHFW